MESSKNAPVKFVTFRLRVIFALQLLLVVGAFAAILSLFVTRQFAQLDDDVRSIVTKTLSGSGSSITLPLHLIYRSAEESALLIHASENIYGMQNINFGNFSSIVSLMTFLLTQVANNPFSQYSWIDFDLEVPFSLDPSYTTVVELTAFQGGGYTIDANGTWRQFNVPVNEVDFSFWNTTIASTTYNNTQAAYPYINTEFGWTNLTEGLWDVPTVWIEQTGNAFLEVFLYRCLRLNTAGTKCTWAYGTDIDMTFVTTMIGSLGSTSESLVALLDLANDQLLATNDHSFPLVNPATTAAWPASANPNGKLRQAYSQFLSRCPTLTNCAPMIDISGEDIIAIIQISPYSSINFALVDIFPRSVYYATAIQSRNVAIAICVVVSLAAVAVCLAILVGIATPLDALIENFELAALLRNEDVVTTKSRIFEIQQVSEQFDRLNQKLLQARAFMPQSMLNNGDYDDEDEGDAQFDEGTAKGAASGDARSSVVRRSITSNRRGPDDVVSVGTSSRRHGQESSHVSRASSNSQKAIHLSNKMRGTFVDKKVTVLVVNMVGFHTFVEVEGWEELFSSWLGEVQQSVKQEKGVVDFFSGDHLVVTFNSSNNASAHCQKAGVCALNILNARERLSTMKQRRLPRVSIGISSGRALSGPLGTATLRSFATIGTPVSQATVLERCARLMTSRDEASTILATENMADDISYQVHAYLCGNCPSIKSRVILVCALIQKSADDEWMYELEQSVKNPYKQIHGVMQAFSDGNESMAKDLFAKHSSSCGDVAAERGWALVKRLVDGNPFNVEV